MTWNRASEDGLRRFDWWKDWRGECVAIIASGPSTKHANIEVLRDRIHVIAIKENVNLCPWADIVYGCDAMWWNHRGGLKDYDGLKISHAHVTFGDVKRIHVNIVHNILVETPGELGSGGNSGFQALNLAVQFGCTGVLLIGYDMHAKGGEHWYGRNLAPGMNNPQESNFRLWRSGFENAAPGLKKQGIEVVNCTPSSAINCFPHRGIEETLKMWGL